MIINSICCWESSTINLIEPEENGYLLTKTISPEEQINNNNPTQLIHNFSYSLCNNTLTDFHLPLNDLDNDSFSLSFCNLFYENGQGQIHYPPPFSEINYLTSGNYSYNYPFGNFGSISIDHATNSLSIFPLFQGRYALSLCINEFKNGVILNQTNFVFQVIVLNCLPEVTANIISDSVTEEGVEILLGCNESEIQVLNTSVCIFMH